MRVISCGIANEEALEYSMSPYNRERGWVLAAHYIYLLFLHLDRVFSRREVYVQAPAHHLFPQQTYEATLLAQQDISTSTLLEAGGDLTASRGPLTTCCLRLGRRAV